MKGFTPLYRRRFCSGRSTKAQQRSTSNMAVAAKPSTRIASRLQNSVAFNNRLNLVRDQGVGGSNPLSPTNLFKHLSCTSGLPSTFDGVEIVDGACIADSQTGFPARFHSDFQRTC